MWFDATRRWRAWLTMKSSRRTPLSESRQRRDEKVVYYIHSSFVGRIIVGVFGKLFGIYAEPLNFRLMDVHDEQGNLSRLKITYFELEKIQKEIFKNEVLVSIRDHGGLSPWLKTYFEKHAVLSDLPGYCPLWKTLFIIHICDWKRRQSDQKSHPCYLFLDRRVWLKEIAAYAQTQNVIIKTLPKIQIHPQFIITKILTRHMRLLKSIRFYIHDKGLLKFTITWIQELIGRKPLSQTPPDDKLLASESKMAVEYYGQLNLNSPQYHSDLSFCQQSGIKGEDVIITFNISRDPCDEKMAKELSRWGARAISLNPKASLSSFAKPYYGWPGQFQKSLSPPQISSLRCPEHTWFREEWNSFENEYHFWLELFKTCHIKIFVSWYKYDALHCVMGEALNTLGGVNVIYQRAFEEFPSPETAVCADIVFGFSRLSFNSEKLSRISNYVITGYLGDHRPRFLKDEAKALRESLQQNGARQIMAYFDEGSASDERWLPGHALTRQNYHFILNKILTHQDIGLILKPKNAISLRERLGPVSPLLDEAIKTKRCFMFEGGLLHAPYPPSAAALACDIAVHGHMFSATAGFESALCGVPTLLLDREGWSVSRLYELKEGRVIFKDWDHLWNAAEEYWKDKKNNPGFGDWSSLMSELDPFRDGQAARRMGDYLNDVLEGLKKGHSKNKAMADASDRYREKWGKDKVIENPRTPS